VEANKIDDLTKFGAEVMIWKRIEQWYQKLGTVHEWHCLIGHMMSGYGLIFAARKIQLDPFWLDQP
jgi:hypothetical protein